MKARRPMKDMKSPMVSVDITDPSMADAEVMDMDDFGADSVTGEEAEKVNRDAIWCNRIYTSHLTFDLIAYYI